MENENRKFRRAIAVAQSPSIGVGASAGTDRPQLFACVRAEYLRVLSQRFDARSLSAPAAERTIQSLHRFANVGRGDRAGNFPNRTNESIDRRFAPPAPRKLPHCSQS